MQNLAHAKHYAFINSTIYIQMAQITPQMEFRRSPDSSSVSNALYTVQGSLSGTSEHAYNAGVNIGWAIETCVGRQTADIHKVLESLRTALAHLIAGGSNKASVTRTINMVINPISNLVNAQHPKPQELPQHKSRVDALRTKLRSFVR